MVQAHALLHCDAVNNVPMQTLYLLVCTARHDLCRSFNTLLLRTKQPWLMLTALTLHTGKIDTAWNPLCCMQILWLIYADIFLSNAFQVDIGAECLTAYSAMQCSANAAVYTMRFVKHTS